MYSCIIIYGYPTKHLHADYCIDEEQHHNQQSDIWQGLKIYYKKHFIHYINFNNIILNSVRQ